MQLERTGVATVTVVTDAFADLGKEVSAALGASALRTALRRAREPRSPDGVGHAPRLGGPAGASGAMPPFQADHFSGGPCA